MKTININGKEYTKDQFVKEIKHWKVNRLFENLEKINQPPMVRPMSELPEGEYPVLFIVQDTKKNTWFYALGTPFELDFCIVVNNETYFKDRDYSAKWSKTKLYGWLPLPNPEDIKL